MGRALRCIFAFLKKKSKGCRFNPSRSFDLKRGFVFKSNTKKNPNFFKLGF